MKTFAPYLFAPLALFALTHCGAGPEDTADDTSATGLTDTTEDNLNGLWTTTYDGEVLDDDVVTESWRAVGFRLHLGSETYAFSRSGTTLTATDGSTLTFDAKGSGVSDDVLDGTVAGKTIHLARDVAPKPPITLDLPGDRPYRAFLNDVLVPAAQRDRESYTVMRYQEMSAFLRSCELYKHGSWQRKYMKGDTWSEQNASFFHLISAVNYVKTTPRMLTHEWKFYTSVNDSLKDPNQAGLAMTTFSMYFAAAAGRSVRIPITDDAMAYFITDRPSRSSRIGLVVMKTPLHGPLASTFGRQLLDMGDMPASDDIAYARTMMQLLAKSDARGAKTLSPAGRSALTDWFAVMAIEDYRGVAFGYPNLGWGYNMTNAQFYGLLVRALARPGETDAAGNPVAGQVVVGSELRPGDPSYADVLNHGSDMQEYGDMSRLKRLTTDYLREQHPDLVVAVEQAFSGVVPASELDARARADLFHYVCAQLYDAKGRTSALTGPKADAAVEAVTSLFSTLRAESTELETYLLAHGLTKSSETAPKSTGY